jgi:hypothetical protein
VRTELFVGWKVAVKHESVVGDPAVGDPAVGTHTIIARPQPHGRVIVVSWGACVFAQVKSDPIIRFWITVAERDLDFVSTLTGLKGVVGAVIGVSDRRSSR